MSTPMNTTGIVADIRPIRQGDQIEARRLIVDGLGEHFGVTDEKANPDLDDILGTYVSRGADFLVAVDTDGRIIGTGCLTYEDDATGRLVRMSTSPDCRRRGVASAILAHLVARAVERGTERILVATEPDWEDAVGFYRAHGFEQFDADPVDIHLLRRLRQDMQIHRINLAEKLSLFADHWSPKIVGELNRQHVKLVKLQGEFVWHHHETEDELFMVLKGKLTIRFRDGEVELREGEFCIVPRGVEHCPVAFEEVHLLLFEPASTLNTGDAEDDRRLDQPEWI